MKQEKTGAALSSVLGHRISQFLKSVAACVLVLAGGLAVNGAALATTPDGDTPANEGVCDILKGGTPGLYGLCVAYCEAQDLDSIEKDPPNTRILANYKKKMQPGDPEMPCVQVPCPCWSAEELAGIVDDNKVAFCGELSSTSLQVIDMQELVPLTGALTKRRFADVDTNPESLRCRYVDLNAPSVIRIQEPTAAEAGSCYTQLQEACAGLTP